MYAIKYKFIYIFFKKKTNVALKLYIKYVGLPKYLLGTYYSVYIGDGTRLRV